MNSLYISLCLLFICVSLKANALMASCLHSEPNNNKDQQLRGHNPYSCYSFVGSKKSQAQASEHCRSAFNGFLARISDPHELATVIRKVPDGTNIWMDIHCDVTTQNCTWGNKEFVGSRMYNLGKNQRPFLFACGALYKRGPPTNISWLTVDCNANHPFLCQSPAVVVDVTRCGNDSFVFNNDCYVIMKYDFTRKESWSGCRMIGGKLADLKGQESVIATTNYLNLRAASLQHDIWVNSLLQVEKNQILLTRLNTGEQVLDSYTGWNWYIPSPNSNVGFLLCHIVDNSVLSAKNLKNFEKPEVTVDHTKTLIAVLGGATAAVVIGMLFVIHYRRSPNKSMKHSSFRNKRRQRARSSTDQHRNEGSHLPSNFITPMATMDSAAEIAAFRSRRSTQSSHNYHQILGDENTYATINSVDVTSMWQLPERNWKKYLKASIPLIFGKKQSEIPLQDGTIENEDAKAINVTEDCCKSNKIPNTRESLCLRDGASKTKSFECEPPKQGTEPEFEYPLVSTTIRWKTPGPEKITTKEIQYADLEFNSELEDEKVMDEIQLTNSPTSLHYADLMLGDEDDKYKKIDETEK